MVGLDRHVAQMDWMAITIRGKAKGVEGESKHGEDG
jgi:hypothetical protein